MEEKDKKINSSSKAKKESSSKVKQTNSSKVNKTESIKQKNNTTKKKTTNTKNIKKVEYVDIKAIEKELLDSKKLPIDEKIKINTKIIPNVFTQLLYTIYIVLLQLGFKNINHDVFITDLKVFSILLIGIAIFVFEKAYKKDNEEIAIRGVELNILAIFNLAFLYIIYVYQNDFVKYIYSAAILVNIYFVVKSIVTLIKSKVSYSKENSEIKEIIKK